MPTKKRSPRINWGKEYTNLPELDLTSVQRQSWQWFLDEGITQAITEVSPIEDFTGKNWLLEFGKFSFDKPQLTSQEAKNKGLTFDIPLKVEATLINKQTGKKITQEVFFGDIPQMSPEGTFVVNGIERAVVNQIVRSPGAFFTGDVDPVTGRMLYMGEIRPNRGSWLEFFVTRNDIISVRIDRRRKFAATTLLRAFGFGSDDQIFSLFSKVEKKDRPFIANTIERDPTKSREEAILEIYRKMRPGEPVVLEHAQELIFNMFLDGRRYDLGKVGRYKINKRLGLTLSNTPENWILRPEDLIGTIAYLVALQYGEGKVDDIDHLANRRVRRVGELVYQAAFRVGLLRMERAIREKMSLISTEEEATPTMLVNARPVIATINEFFRSNQLSTILDQTNPLSELDNLRRLSVMGPGGITRERASFSIRDINSSQYGRVCPVRSPEGPNIGLVTYMALFSRINEYGFLETPYRKVVKVGEGKSAKMKTTNEIVYFPSDDEEEYYITHAGINIDENGYLLDSWVPARYRGEFLEIPVEKVSYIDIVPRQVVGISTSLMPFLSHDEANRALMGTHMQCQAVPLVNPSAPLVGTGMEKTVAESMNRVVKARHDGKVIYADAQKIIIELSQKPDKNEVLEINEKIQLEGKRETYLIKKFERTNPGSTCYSQRVVVKIGDKVKKGDLLADGPATDGGEIALGQNLLIAYCAFEGLGYEDAIVISDRLVKQDVLTSITIEEHEASVVDTKLGPEELTRDIPNVSEEDLAHLGPDGIVVIGSEVGSNEILVGKIAPKGETELTAEERLLRAIFGEKAREVRDTSLRMPHGERGIVIGISILDREKSDELEPGTNKKVIVKVAQIRKVVVGDKLAGRHGNKGVISKIVPAADMPYLPDGTPVDILISSLSVLARMNLGQLMEAHLGWAAFKQNVSYGVPVFEKISEQKIVDELKKAGLPEDGKTVLYDGRTGMPFEQKAAVGIAYMMKLIHMVEDKTHARSTGPYSLVTQQPLGGKAQMGGQRLGEMEVWALEAHRAAYTLQEMLTLKSDDVIGRGRAFEAIVKGTNIPQASVPESFKVLMKELASLGLSVTPTGVVEETEKVVDEQNFPVNEEKVEKQAKALAVAAGAEEVTVPVETNSAGGVI
ncbi:DNA-directed RNA polymerase subunit beta [Candidatus Shapirobacteria bacterium CG08_land_8_20_14_0_20_39_18]|uniref:DNA-directed RNA polymerase subunit beta n=1 Tax=Candidatus Shapirobacteria bacterium CG08_land_8_20_14_0_20_39_18 TaxID=1974883 RepID=A0A2M6XC78_9BACT|nr:MAG: DNA-directed RNA polymerase subunit beta [Candidatus Shapirobacteria bacterium CG08_land_8_20_14_0_20_39_18]PIY66382.1 MAG: DNA-directed RNA polymerase subunit beta [Candidatus Shapirobacteria bacterium CG_4_10_14_0_8_um_filter_39_15]PJE68318.1 MAG: DNA-directed RNA polymerase subunit beta [Candidatus Shapirobacteria bacterium CG10_big_fil_rev_8_21_14_0_10_38_8]